MLEAEIALGILLLLGMACVVGVAYKALRPQAPASSEHLGATPPDLDVIASEFPEAKTLLQETTETMLLRPKRAALSGG